MARVASASYTSCVTSNVILQGLNALAEERGWVVEVLSQWVVEVLSLVAGQRSAREKRVARGHEDVWDKRRGREKNHLQAR